MAPHRVFFRGTESIFIVIHTKRAQGYHVLLNLDRLGAGSPHLPTSQTSTNDSSLQFTTRIITDREPAAAVHSYELTTLNASTSGTGG